ncbi:hypothetical protein [Pantoea sp. A4]|uniref:hypothetical protein n=1 Tax=Pantoea sp. A4 TaxID=1225184 RepID=UPI000AF54637|nr:hypothetical protein [Pantoea sp. A4]
MSNKILLVILMFTPIHFSYAECDRINPSEECMKLIGQPPPDIVNIHMSKGQEDPEITKEINDMHDAIKPDGKSFLPHNNINTTPLWNTKSSLQTTTAHE